MPDDMTLTEVLEEAKMGEHFCSVRMEGAHRTIVMDDMDRLNWLPYGVGPVWCRRSIASGWVRQSECPVCNAKSRKEGRE